MTIGQSIRKMRKLKGLTQVQLAEAIGCYPCQISHWESDSLYPHILNCVSLADFFQVSIDELVGRNNKKS